MHSKRAAEIDAAVRARGESSYRARSIAARDTRGVKRHTPVGELMPRWHQELAEVGWSAPELVAAVELAVREVELPGPLGEREVLGLLREVLDPEGRLSTEKVFTAADVVVAVAPALFGRPEEELLRAVGRVLAAPEAVPLLGVAGARELAYATAAVLATEAAIAEIVARGTGTSGAATSRRRWWRRRLPGPRASSAVRSRPGRPLRSEGFAERAGGCRSYSAWPGRGRRPRSAAWRTPMPPRGTRCSARPRRVRRPAPSAGKPA